ncbi:hypothetical protein HMPREF0101_02238 [Bacteroides fragilis]|nr:hypothetical protein HMPREF0101_02238 [Bacteroides fragilis]
MKKKASIRYAISRFALNQNSHSPQIHTDEYRQLSID